MTEEITEEITEKTEQAIDNSDDIYQQKVINGIIDLPEINVRIHAILDNINIEHKFNKSVIFLYHDGIKTPTGMPFIRYSMKYERIRQGKIKIEPQSTYAQNLGAEGTAYFLVNIKKNGYYVCDDIEKIGDGMILYQYKELGVKSISCFPIYDRELQLVGLMMNYSFDHIHNYTDSEIDELEIETAKISSLIDLIYYGDRQEK